MALFQSQDYTLVLAGTGQDLSTATVLKIRYTKPSNIIGELPADFQGTGNEDAFVDISASLNNEVGVWRFQIEAVISGRTFLSSLATIKIHESLEDPTP